MKHPTNHVDELVLGIHATKGDTLQFWFTSSYVASCCNTRLWLISSIFSQSAPIRLVRHLIHWPSLLRIPGTPSWPNVGTGIPSHAPHSQSSETSWTLFWRRTARPSTWVWIPMASTSQWLTPILTQMMMCSPAFRGHHQIPVNSNHQQKTSECPLVALSSCYPLDNYPSAQAQVKPVSKSRE